MTPLRDRTIAARVPLDLREDLETIASRGGVDLTTVIRGALRGYADASLGRDTDAAAGYRAILDLAAASIPGRGLFGAAQGAARRRDRSTSTQAAIDVAPRTGSQRRRALAIIAAAGDKGATADEVIEVLQAAARGAGVRGPAVNGVARRVTDLLQAGAIAPVLIEETRSSLADGTARQELTRPTRNGSAATVYRITSKGRAWLQEASQNGR